MATYLSEDEQAIFSVFLQEAVYFSQQPFGRDKHAARLPCWL
jgi:hypothetical protein